MLDISCSPPVLSCAVFQPLRKVRFTPQAQPKLAAVLVTLLHSGMLEYVMPFSCNMDRHRSMNNTDVACCCVGLTAVLLLPIISYMCRCNPIWTSTGPGTIAQLHLSTQVCYSIPHNSVLDLRHVCLQSIVFPDASTFDRNFDDILTKLPYTLSQGADKQGCIAGLNDAEVSCPRLSAQLATYITEGERYYDVTIFTCDGGPYDANTLASLVSGIPPFLLYFVNGDTPLSLGQ